jgi:hypothetical protein
MLRMDRAPPLEERLGAPRSLYTILSQIPEQMQPGYSDQLRPLQARVPVLADDDVIVHGNAER